MHEVMKHVVISQPMLFPWVGMFEQLRLCDAFIYFDDVQYPRRAFVNRVQIKTKEGWTWLTVPLAENRREDRINEVKISYTDDWIGKHFRLFEASYKRAPHFAEAFALLERCYNTRAERLVDLLIAGFDDVANYFGLGSTRHFAKSSELGVEGESSTRLAGLVERCGGKVYITGHGAKDYLDYELFESKGIRVEYIHYEKRPYPQLHGEFNPYVSILDLIANVGKAGVDYLCSESQYWKTFLAA